MRLNRAARVTRQRRRDLEEQAKGIRLRGQLESWGIERIAAEIVSHLPDILPLEAYRFAAGWTREQLSQAIDILYSQDGRQPPRVSATEICGWEHGRHTPQPERQDCLARVYRTRPDRLGFGRDHSAAPAFPGSSPHPALPAGAPEGAPAPEPMAAALSPPSAPAESLEPLTESIGEPHDRGPVWIGGVLEAGSDADGISVVVGPELHITSVQLPGPASGGSGVIIELEGSDMDRRTVIKLLGGLAAGGFAPNIDLDHLVSAARTPTHLDTALVGSLQAVTNAYASQRQATGPAIVLPPVLGHLSYLKTLLAGTVDEPVRRELGLVVGETSVLAGWLSFLTENLGEARAHYAFAKQVAREIGDRRLAAQALVAESALHFTTAYARLDRDTHRALRLLDEAAERESALPAPMRAWLACRQAEELATLKDASGAHRALDRAREAVNRIDAGDLGGFYSSWSEAKVSGYEGTCRMLLEDARGASVILERALQAVEPFRVTARAGLMADLGGTYVMQGELAQGASLIGDAYEDSAGVGYALGMHRAFLMRARTIGRELSDQPAVRDLDQRLNAASG